MKKVLVFLLATLMIVSCILLVACDVTVTEISLKGVPEKVAQNTTIDYSKISVVAKHDDDSVKEIPLTDKSVKYDPIDTKTTGAKTLSVTYGGKSTQATITVEAGTVDVETITVTEFNNTPGYLAYQEAKAVKSNKETEFVIRDKHYQVGTANGYRLVPQVTAIDENLEDVELPESQIKTDYTLYIDNSGSWVEVPKTNNYLSEVENNVYYFTQTAEGHTFKLVVTLSEGFELLTDKTTVEQEFEVVSGYNVYDALGLSVLDNKNVKSWASLKTHKYDWDGEKALKDFTDVTQVILHNNITITTEYLPDNYFWKTTDNAVKDGGISYNQALSKVPAGYEDYLAGSLKETMLDEEWDYHNSEQRGLYISDGIGLSGNYLTIDYEANYNTKGEKGIYIVHDFADRKKDYPEAHWSVIKYMLKTDETKGNATIENVYFLGESGKTEKSGLPAGIMVMSTEIDAASVINTIASDWFGNFELDGATDAETTFDLVDSKMYNSFSQMVYSYAMKEINIVNSEMKRAGGPIIILQTRTSSNEADVIDTKINIDDKSVLESWLTGWEMWFAVNNLPGTDVEQMFAVASMVDAGEKTGTHYATKKKVTIEGKEQEINAVNLMMIVIPEASNVFTNQHVLKGTVTIGSTTYSMDEPVLNAFKNVQEISADGVDAAQTTIGVLQAAHEYGQLGGMSEEEYNGYITQLQQLVGGFGMLPQLPVAPVYKSGVNYGFFDGSNFQTIAFLQQLYGGAQLAQGMLTQFQQADAAAKWNSVLDNQYMQTIASVDASTGAWTAGHVACWINPGGLNNPPVFNIQPFMVILGEGTVAAA